MMVCGICSHSQRTEIDAALVDGTSLRVIAGQYGTTKSALDRHRKHIPTALVKAKEAIEVADASSLLSRVEKLMSRCEKICEKAEAQEHWTGAIGAVREMRGCLELLGKLNGELKTPGMNLSIKQSFAEISIRDLSDQQLKELIEVLDREDLDRLRSIERLSNEDIAEQLSNLTGIPAATLLGPATPRERQQ